MSIVEKILNFNNKIDKKIKILTNKKMLQRVLITLAQVKIT